MSKRALFRGEPHVGEGERGQLLRRVRVGGQCGAVAALLFLVALQGRRSQRSPHDGRRSSATTGMRPAAGQEVLCGRARSAVGGTVS
jgi:hypothetical protein